MEQSAVNPPVRKSSSKLKWLIVIGIIVFVLVGICASCFGLMLLGSEDFSTTSQTQEPSFNIKGSTSQTIAVINLEGIILDDSADAVYEQNVVDYAVGALDKAKSDKNVKAVILVLNTPGGSTYDTARIGDKIDEVKAEGKLVVSVMEQVAASGGYWIAAKSDYIVTGSQTITGSVGALWDIVLYDRLLEKIGVDQLRIHNIESPNKTIGDGDTRNQEGDKYKILQELANKSYDEFVSVIEEGRGKSRSEFGNLLDGRIVDGTQAVEAGMADQLGYFEDAVEYVKNELGLTNPNVKTYEREKLSPFNSIFAKLNILTPAVDESHVRMRIMLLPTFVSSNSEGENN